MTVSSHLYYNTNHWIKTALVLVNTLNFFLTANIQAQAPPLPINSKKKTDLVKLSTDFLVALKNKNSTTKFEKTLEDIKILEIENQLNTDDKKRVFWINIYNTYFQKLAINPNIEKENIYKIEAIRIANQRWSLNNIEHGILRKQEKNLNKNFLKNLTVEKVDYHIHFALNCGAESCPPIPYLSLEENKIQLENALNNFLKKDTVIDKKNKVIHITKLFEWFKDDFENEENIKKILGNSLKLRLKNYTLKFKEYSWKSKLRNFKENTFI